MSGAIGFLAASIESPEWFDEAWDPGKDPDLWWYRERTVAILRRFFRMSRDTGKVPSILGQEFFRSRVTSYRATTTGEAIKVGNLQALKYRFEGLGAIGADGREEKADSDDLAAILLKQLGLTSAPEGEEESSATVGAVARESDSVE